MALEYSIVAEPSMIVLRVSGIPDRDSITEMWRAVAAAGDKYDCRDVLGLSTTERPVELAVAIDAEKIFMNAGISNDYRIAWVNPNAAASVMINLIEEVLKNRKLADGRGFADEQSARRWLAGND